MRKFKRIPDAQLADYGSPRRLAQNTYNDLVSKYEQFQSDADRAKINMATTSPTILMWQNAIRALRGV